MDVERRARVDYLIDRLDHDGPYRSMVPVPPKPVPYREPAWHRLAVLLGFMAGPTAFTVVLRHLDWSDSRG